MKWRQDIMPKGAGQDKLQPACNRGPHSSGTVDGTSAPMPAWSVPWCWMAWLYDQVPPPCPGAAQEPWCCQGHQQWGWGQWPAAHTEDHWQWLPLVALLSGGVQERVWWACGKGHQQGWSFQVCTGFQNWTVWAVRPIFAPKPLISQSGSRSVDCFGDDLELPSQQVMPESFPLLPIIWRETPASCCCRVNCFSHCAEGASWQREALLTSHPVPGTGWRWACHGWRPAPRWKAWCSQRSKYRSCCQNPLQGSEGLLVLGTPKPGYISCLLLEVLGSFTHPWSGPAILINRR